MKIWARFSSLPQRFCLMSMGRSQVGAQLRASPALTTPCSPHVLDLVKQENHCWNQEKFTRLAQIRIHPLK